MRPVDRTNDFPGLETQIRNTDTQIRMVEREVPPDPTAFTHPHFPDEPNILVHTRSGEHALPTGERGRVIENVQSDWMQEGREKGFRESPKSMKAKLIDGEYWQVNDADNGQFVMRIWPSDWRRRLGDGFDMRPIAIDNTEAGVIAEARRRIDSSKYTRGEAVPDGPFKESWPNLGMEREIVDAAESGAEWIAITPSEVLRNRAEMISPQFQDQRLPNILEKLLAPFGGGSQEMAEISKGVFAPIVRLTPEMRKRILKEGIPLMALMAAINEAGGEESPPPQGTMGNVLAQ